MGVDKDSLASWLSRWSDRRCRDTKPTCPISQRFLAIRVIEDVSKQLRLLTRPKDRQQLRRTHSFHNLELIFRSVEESSW